MAQTKKRKKTPPASPSSREAKRQVAVEELVDKRIADGTASSQILTVFLKRNTIRDQLEVEKLRQENLLLEAKIKSEAASSTIQDLFEEVLDAIRGYQGPRYD